MAVVVIRCGRPVFDNFLQSGWFSSEVSGAFTTHAPSLRLSSYTYPCKEKVTLVCKTLERPVYGKKKKKKGYCIGDLHSQR